MKILLALLLASAIVRSGHAEMTLRAEHINGNLWNAFVAYVPPNDPTPNPCFGRGAACHVIGVTVPISSYPTSEGGKISGVTWYTPLPHFRYATIGELWAAVTNKNQRAGAMNADYRPELCMAVYATQIGFSLPPVSNCVGAGAVPPPTPTCNLSPQSIPVVLNGIKGGSAPVADVSGISVQCDRAASVRISTNSGESIPLNGSSVTKAVLDWGSGFGSPHTIAVPGNNAWPVPLRVKIVGFEQADAGVYTGVSVVNLSYD